MNCSGSDLYFPIVFYVVFTNFSLFAGKVRIAGNKFPNDVLNDELITCIYYYYEIVLIKINLKVIDLLNKQWLLALHESSS